MERAANLQFRHIFHRDPMKFIEGDWKYLTEPTAADLEIRKLLSYARFPGLMGVDMEFVFGKQKGELPLLLPYEPVVGRVSPKKHPGPFVRSVQIANDSKTWVFDCYSLCANNGGKLPNSLVRILSDEKWEDIPLVRFCFDPAQDKEALKNSFGVVLNCQYDLRVWWEGLVSPTVDSTFLKTVNDELRVDLFKRRDQYFNFFNNRLNLAHIREQARDKYLYLETNLTGKYSKNYFPRWMCLYFLSGGDRHAVAQKKGDNTLEGLVKCLFPGLLISLEKKDYQRADFHRDGNPKLPADLVEYAGRDARWILDLALYLALWVDYCRNETWCWNLKATLVS